MLSSSRCGTRFSARPARPSTTRTRFSSRRPVSLSNVDGDSGYVRIQVLTNAGALDRGKQLAVVERLTAIAADAAGDPALVGRTWVLLTEAPDGGWGLAGHANTNEELVAAARAQIASLAASEEASG
jgi:phenylpyruvate tautomerase PptA (4-oxalocrotonate tautomerase family)